MSTIKVAALATLGNVALFGGGFGVWYSLQMARQEGVRQVVAGIVQATGAGQPFRVENLNCSCAAPPATPTPPAQPAPLSSEVPK